MNIREGLTFDDVLLEPKFSAVQSRADIDLSVNLNGLKFAHPIIPANMRSIAGYAVALEAMRAEGLAILHRFDTIRIQVIAFKKLERFATLNGQNVSQHVGVSLGVHTEDKTALAEWWDLGVRIFCIDVAHGDLELSFQMVNRVRDYAEKHRAGGERCTIIAGNVATGAAALRSWNCGAHVVKVGVGPGSLCTTRVETGCGVPQLTALEDVALARRHVARPSETIGIIADGGMKSAGDMVKALCFADMVMTGNLFAGCEEAPGREIQINGRRLKEYVGSSTHKTTHVEGVEAMTPVKGPFSDVLTKLTDGIRSGCSYQGVSKVGDLKKDPRFIRMTSAGRVESGPHDVTIFGG